MLVLLKLYQNGETDITVPSFW